MIVINNIESLPKEQQLRLQTQAEYWGSQMADLPQPDRIETLTCNTQRYDSPLVSVIIPVYNVEKYLFRSMTSLLNQTCREIEIICVDDCSTDASLQILEFFAMLDARIQIIRHQKNSFAGVARNTGMAQAKGKYLFFADPDDWCNAHLLSVLVENAQKNHSDLVMFSVDAIDALSGECTWKLQPQSWAKELSAPFSRRDFPTRILTATTPHPWNKLFRHDFVVTKKLFFQTQHNCNDLYFSTMALALADRISYEPATSLYFYRRNTPGSLQATCEQHPMCILNAPLKIIQELKRRNLYDELVVSCNKLIQTLLLKSLMLRPFRGAVFETFYQGLRKDFLPEFGDLTPYSPNFEIVYNYLRINQSGSDFLIDMDCYHRQQMNKFKTERDKFKTERDKFKTERDKQKKSLRKLKASRSYQIGRAVTWAPRMVRNAYRCFKQHGLAYTLKRIPVKIQTIYRKFFR